MIELEEIICPHCQGFTKYDTTADEIICTICNQLITEEDLENVFTGDTTDIS